MTTADTLEQIAIDAMNGQSGPSLYARIARQALDVRRMERTLNELCAEAQDEAQGEARVEAWNLAAMAGILVEFPPARIVRHIDIRSAT